MTGQEGVSVECVLCDVYDHRDEDDSHVVAVGGTVFTMLNKFPYSSGHLMVVPVRHVRSLPELDDAELLDAMHAVGQAMKVLEQVYVRRDLLQYRHPLLLQEMPIRSL